MLISQPKPKGFQKKMDDGKRVNVYLDPATLEAARNLGNGNVSDGIRQALKNYGNIQQEQPLGDL